MKKTIPKYRIYQWGDRYMYLGQIIDNSEHMHHAVQLILNREGLFQLGIEGAIIECGGAIIRSDCPHQLLSTSDSQVHLWMDHEADVARAITERHLGRGNIKILKGALLERLRECFKTPGNYLGSCDQAHDVCKKIVSALGGYEAHLEETIDPRIQATMQLLQKKYISRKVSIAELARHAGLSQSRLMHLFTEQVGIPLRRYVLWLRLMTTVRLAIQGKSLTEAAHSAGFSDSAHLSRTYRRMYGIPLTSCVSSFRSIQAIACFK